MAAAIKYNLPRQFQVSVTRMGSKRGEGTGGNKIVVIIKLLFKGVLINYNYFLILFYI